MGLGSIIQLISEDAKKDVQRDLDNEIKNAPKYGINKEAFENQAIAKQQAYGRNAAVITQEEQIDEDAANAAFEAQNITSSSSALLSTLAAINSGKISKRRDLAALEGQFQQQGQQNLMTANAAMIDEKDKAWNYNVNMPYQMRIAKLRDQVKFLSDMSLSGMGYEASTSSAFMGSMGSMMGGA